MVEKFPIGVIEVGRFCDGGVSLLDVSLLNHLTFLKWDINY